MDIEAQAIIDNLKEENLRLKLEINELKSDYISKIDYENVMSEPKFNAKLSKLLKQENVIEPDKDSCYKLGNDMIEYRYGKVIDKYGEVDYISAPDNGLPVKFSNTKPIADGQYEIPEGWEEIHIMFKEVPIGSNVKDFREMKIEKEGKLAHHFIYITDFNIVKVFDKATGKMYDNNELEVGL